MKQLPGILAAAIVLLATSARAQAADNSDTAAIRPAFTWGASAGASIDMSGNDMSIGAEADIMVSNSCRSFPLFAELRTNFTDRPTLAFWDIKLGASLNYLEHNHQQTGIYGFTGAGFNLARSSKFASFILLGYTFRQRRKVVGHEMAHDFHDLHYATVKIGVSF